MSVAIQGGPASFHEQAANVLYSAESPSYYSSFGECFTAVTNRTDTSGVVAIENSLYGSIHEVLDLLLMHPARITGDYVVHIHQQLIGLEGAKLEDITEVYSHPVALDQCKEFLAMRLPNARVIEYEDTADAVKYIKDTGNPLAAAIAGRSAASLYSLPIIAADIEDEATNLTRFISIKHKDDAPETTSNANFALLVLTMPHEAGSLHRALGCFTESGSNLTKIESRPIRGESFRYQFFIDAEATVAQLAKIVTSIEQIGGNLKVLGHYHRPNL